MDEYVEKLWRISEDKMTGLQVTQQYYYISVQQGLNATELVLTGSECHRVVLTGSECHRVVLTGSECHRVMLTGSECHRVSANRE